MKRTQWGRRTGNKCRECGAPLKPVGFDAGRPQEFCEACNLERIRARKRAWNARQKIRRSGGLFRPFCGDSLTRQIDS
jgi:hypothetical protein